MRRGGRVGPGYPEGTLLGVWLCILGWQQAAAAGANEADEAGHAAEKAAPKIPAPAPAQAPPPPSLAS
ncbi:hypothetical protein Tco_1512761 [Tanacetum coccineum]